MLVNLLGAWVLSLGGFLFVLFYLHWSKEVLNLILKCKETKVCWGIGSHNHQSLLVVFAMF